MYTGPMQDAVASGRPLTNDFARRVREALQVEQHRVSDDWADIPEHAVRTVQSGRQAQGWARLEKEEALSVLVAIQIRSENGALLIGHACPPRIGRWIVVGQDSPRTELKCQLGEIGRPGADSGGVKEWYVLASRPSVDLGRDPIPHHLSNRSTSDGQPSAAARLGRRSVRPVGALSIWRVVDGSLGLKPELCQVDAVGVEEVDSRAIREHEM